MLDTIKQELQKFIDSRFFRKLWGKYSYRQKSALIFTALFAFAVLGIKGAAGCLLGFLFSAYQED